MKERSERQIWNLKAKDFVKKSVHASQDWRFQMFFEYLRISPSYALAVKINKKELAIRLDDAARAELVWKTRMDIGDVFEILYREWWLENGLNLFGIHTKKPKIELIQRLSPLLEDDLLLTQSGKEIKNYMKGDYLEQGRPDSILLSIPLGQKRTATIRELKKLLSAIENEATPFVPSTLYQIQNNKMQYRRLLAGLKLIYMRAANPKEALWQVAARAKISYSHGRIDPNAPKKDLQNAQGRRMLTIMASRLIHDTLIIAENAATGIFPSLELIDTHLFDAESLQKSLHKTIKWERDRKAELLALSRTVT